MSIEQLQKVVGRAVTDPQYRDLLFTNPEGAVQGYDLTGDEMAAIKGLTRPQFEAAVSELDERVSKATLFTPTASDAFTASVNTLMVNLNLNRW